MTDYINTDWIGLSITTTETTTSTTSVIYDTDIINATRRDLATSYSDLMSYDYNSKMDMKITPKLGDEVEYQGNCGIVVGRHYRESYVILSNNQIDDNYYKLCKEDLDNDLKVLKYLGIKADSSILIFEKDYDIKIVNRLKDIE